MKSSSRVLERFRTRRAPYAALFALAVVALLVGAVTTFQQIGSAALRSMAADSASRAMTSWPGDTLDQLGRPMLAAPSAGDYARLAAEDRAWRERHARPVTLKELRARGDGRRSARQVMQDRVYAHQRAGRRDQAIAELDRWVVAHPRDADALLWLARLLREAGRIDDAARRYRQLLDLQSPGRAP